jgi:hypothetical protein
VTSPSTEVAFATWKTPFLSDAISRRTLINAPAYGTHKWLVTNYEAGDVVFHDPYSIHASGRNEDPTGRIRLSTDLRFYEKDDPGIDKRWFKIWAPGDGL